ncbi:MAG: hypothetical protein IPF92_10345 [Myxococcales bacterium]|nr:hypothetical protein [Myxococcales bacterium]MBL0192855.1 hypothetical protein [Myxococcales bacterium]HQY64801.1 hypothetical protein [Polyangiaceae bacterium]
MTSPSLPRFRNHAAGRALAWIVALAAATPVLHSAAAQAQTPQDEALTKRARARFQEGVDAFDKGQFENARLSFLEAYALKKHPAVLLNLAQSCLRSGHSGEAARYFQQFIHDSTQATPTQRADAEKGLADARSKGARVEVTAPAGTDILLVTAAGDVKLGSTPLREPLDIDAGTSTLKGRLPSGTMETATVSARAGQRTTARFGQAAAPVPVPVPVPTPTPTPTPTPSAASVEPPAGPPKVDPPPGEDAAPAPAAKKNWLAPPQTLWPVYVGGGVGVAGLVGTVVFILARGSAATSAENNTAEIRKAAAKRNLSTSGICTSPPAEFKQACAQLESNNSSVNTFNTLAIVSGVTLAAGVVFAGAYYLLAPKRETTAAKLLPWVYPLVQPDGGGVAVGHSF